MPTKTAGERETILRFSDDKDEPLTIYTHSRKLRDRLTRFKATPKLTSKVDGEAIAWTFEVSRDWFKAPGPKTRRSGGNVDALRLAREARKARKASLQTENSKVSG